VRDEPQPKTNKLITIATAATPPNGDEPRPAPFRRFEGDLEQSGSSTTTLKTP